MKVRYDVKMRYEYPFNAIVDMWYNGTVIYEDWLKQQTDLDAATERVKQNLLLAINFVVERFPTTPENRERRRQMYFAHYRDGALYTEIGKQFGITGSRARQIVNSVNWRLGRQWLTNAILNMDTDKFKEFIMKDESDQAVVERQHHHISIVIQDTRTYNALIRQNYTTLDEVFQAGATKIMRVRNFGASCLKVVINALEENHYDVESFLER